MFRLDQNYKDHTHQATSTTNLNFNFNESLKLPDECGPYNFGLYETELSQ